MGMQDLNNILVDYIEKNKINYDISYEDSLETLQELLDNIKKEYEV